MAEANANAPDEGPHADRYEPLTVVGDPLKANLVAAQLRAQGIAVRVHGESTGPYPVTVGGLAQVEIWVDAGRLSEARQIATELID